MASSNPDFQIVLYDLPTKGQATAWSLNPWKTRLALNFKGIDYETQWIEYPDIEPTWKAQNVPPNATFPPYTVPAARFSAGLTVQESRLIATELEAQFPAPAHPSLRLDSPLLPRVEAAVSSLFAVLRAELLPRVPALLSPVSAEYFERTRRQRNGVRSLAEWRAEKGGEGAWEAAREPLAALAALIAGPFVLGEEVSYADFVVVGFLKFVLMLDPLAWERIAREDEKFRAIYEGCAEWLKREDY